MQRSNYIFITQMLDIIILIQDHSAKQLAMERILVAALAGSES
jgi:hypothetical protein